MRSANIQDWPGSKNEIIQHYAIRTSTDSAPGLVTTDKQSNSDRANLNNGGQLAGHKRHKQRRKLVRVLLNALVGVVHPGVERHQAMQVVAMEIPTVRASARREDAIGRAHAHTMTALTRAHKV